ncbi:MAG: RDD family protein [Bdellovibrionota bacterium]|jgi:hypothetical protein
MKGEINWYYLLNGKSIGPFSKKQLLAMASSGTIQKNTLVWCSDDTQGCAPLEQAFAFKKESPSAPLNTPSSTPLNDTPTEEVLTQTTEEFKEQKIPFFYHSLRRYFARCLDYTICEYLIKIIFFALNPIAAKEFFTYIEKSELSFVVLFFIYAITLFLNAALIGYTGTTIGKWLFGIRVVDSTGSPISYKRALHREFLVWLRGVGLGIFPIIFGTLLYQSHQFEKNNSTSWDRDLKLSVVYRKPDFRQFFLGLIAYDIISILLTRLHKALLDVVDM